MNTNRATVQRKADESGAGGYQLVERLLLLGTDQTICILRDARGARAACTDEEWEAIHAVRSGHAPADSGSEKSGAAAADSVSSDSAAVTTDSRAAAKYTLFRSLFRGREDVYARRFWSSNTGKTGYAPVCANRWNNALCDMKLHKCRDCPNHSCPKLTDAVLRDHMLGEDRHGRDVIGVYPMLDDSTVWFLAADFDGGNWQKDADAFRAACRSAGLTPAVERSRSGEGAHVWLFFEEPVSARDARRLGMGLLASAMQIRHEISLSSYDRLFPSQDYMPKGGFGNLIALPFQGRARAAGNSMFVDDAWQPYPDQWAFLSTLTRISVEQLEDLLVRFGAADQETGAAMLSAPAPISKTRAGSIDFPKTARLILRNGVYVPKDGLSQGAMAAVRRIAAFHNPEFHKRQNARLSVYNTPAMIDCGAEDDKYILLPRGCLDQVTALFAAHGASCTVQDERNSGLQISAEFTGELRLDQAAALEDLLAHDTGVLAAATAFGKTVVSAAAIARRKVNTLVLVHTTTLLDQWKRALEKYLDFEGFPADDCIGQIGAGRNTRTGKVDIATMQSLVSRDEHEVKGFAADYGMVICDECHHIGAANFERILKRVEAKYVYGLSATPDRADGLERIVYMQCGPVRHKVDAKKHLESRGLSGVVIPRITRTCLQEDDFQQQCSALAADEDRNDLIARGRAAGGRTHTNSADPPTGTCEAAG